METTGETARLIIDSISILNSVTSQIDIIHQKGDTHLVMMDGIKGTLITIKNTNEHEKITLNPCNFEKVNRKIKEGDQIKLIMNPEYTQIRIKNKKDRLFLFKERNLEDYQEPNRLTNNITKINTLNPQSYILLPSEELNEIINDATMNVVSSKGGTESIKIILTPNQFSINDKSDESNISSTQSSLLSFKKNEINCPSKIVNGYNARLIKPFLKKMTSRFPKVKIMLEKDMPLKLFYFEPKRTIQFLIAPLNIDR